MLPSIKIGAKSFKLRTKLTKEETQRLNEPLRNEDDFQPLHIHESHALEATAGSVIGADEMFHNIIMTTLTRCFNNPEEIRALSNRDVSMLFLKLLEYCEQESE